MLNCLVRKHSFSKEDLVFFAKKTCLLRQHNLTKITRWDFKERSLKYCLISSVQLLEKQGVAAHGRISQVLFYEEIGCFNVVLSFQMPVNSSRVAWSRTTQVFFTSTLLTSLLISPGPFHFNYFFFFLFFSWICFITIALRVRKCCIHWVYLYVLYLVKNHFHKEK